MTNPFASFAGFARNIKQGTDEFCDRRLEQAVTWLMTPTEMSILS